MLDFLRQHSTDHMHVTGACKFSIKIFSGQVILLVLNRLIDSRRIVSTNSSNVVCFLHDNNRASPARLARSHHAFQVYLTLAQAYPSMYRELCF